MNVNMFLLCSAIVTLSLIGLLANLFIITFYYSNYRKHVSIIYTSLAFIQTLICCAALCQAFTLASTQQLLPFPNNNLHTSTFLLVHTGVLNFCQRLSGFMNSLLCIVRTLEIVYPFITINIRYIIISTAVYSILVAAMLIFCVLFNTPTTALVTCLTPVQCVHGPDNPIIFHTFYTLPYLIPCLIITLSMMITFYKLKLSPATLSIPLSSHRQNKDRQMAVTIFIIALLFLLCNLSNVAFLLSILDINNFSYTLAIQQHKYYLTLAYILEHLLCFIEASVTPIIIFVRGSQLRRYHKEKTLSLIKRCFSFSSVKIDNKPQYVPSKTVSTCPTITVSRKCNL